MLVLTIPIDNRSNVAIYFIIDHDYGNFKHLNGKKDVGSLFSSSCGCYKAN